MEEERAVRYARVRAIDWNGNIGHFSPIVNLENGLATSNHIGFQAATAIVRAQFGPDTFICDGIDLITGEVQPLVDSLFGAGVLSSGVELSAIFFGHTDIETQGGTVLVDAGLAVRWYTIGGNAEIVVTLWMDDQIIDQSGVLPFPCDTDLAGLPDAVSLLSGLGLPTQVSAGLHTFYCSVESINVDDIYIEVSSLTVTLLELRR